jgi:threonyl-tRNA synthetase
MFIIGEREVENRTVSVRVREEGDIGAMDLNVAVERVCVEADVDF